jgi:hypothetical protein
MVVSPNPHRPIGDFLAGFGDMLPLMAPNGKTAADQGQMLDPGKFNADVMIRTLKMKVVWTDILGTHLDFDGTTNTLFLFRQATLCLLNSGDERTTGRTPLQRSVYS